MANLNIQDNSGDREFFTILPNYIANHSTANDQALYFQMKRYAGEDGKCFATEKTLMRKMRIGKKAYDKSIAYLLERKWITYIGLSGGKTRPIKTYSINNIWKLNSDHYRKISSESTLSKDMSQKEGDKSQKQHKISAESNVEEDPVLRRTIKEETPLPPKGGDSLFMRFWTEYPKKVGKVVAERSFLRINPSEDLFSAMVKDIRRRRESEDWQKQDGKFIPYPATYLNQRRWEDETRPSDEDVKVPEYYRKYQRENGKNI